jgi:hypothetical protein
MQKFTTNWHADISRTFMLAPTLSNSAVSTELLSVCSAGVDYLDVSFILSQVLRGHMYRQLNYTYISSEIVMSDSMYSPHMLHSLAEIQD